MCSCETLCFSGYPRKKCWKNFGQVWVWRKVRKEARKWKKSCQAPCFCQEELLRQSCDRLGGACEEASINVRSDQEFAWAGWSPSLMKYMENTKFCSCQTLEVLITHFQLEPCSTSSSACRMCHTKQNPPHVPKLHPVEDFLKSYKGWFARDAKKPKRSTSSSSWWRSAYATWTEGQSKHVWTDSVKTDIHEAAEGSPWDLLGRVFFFKVLVSRFSELFALHQNFTNKFYTSTQHFCHILMDTPYSLNPRKTKASQK